MNTQNDTVEEKDEEVVEPEVVEEQVNEWEDKARRALADYQNLEKRVRDDRINLIRSANKDLLLRFLPVLDTLILANQHVANEGLQLSINQFTDTLKSEGVVKIDTKDKKFDPLLMEVVSTGEGKEGVVIQEVRTGYLLHDILLRPAQVIVGKEKN